MRLKSIAQGALAAGLLLGSLNLAACAHHRKCCNKGEVGADHQCGGSCCGEKKDEKGGSVSCGQGNCSNGEEKKK